MNTTTYSPESVKRFRENISALVALSERYNGDPDLKSRIDAGDVTESLQELGIKLSKGTQAKIVANTADTFHVILPADPNKGLSDEALATVAGGGKSLGSAGTAGSVSTFGSAMGCLGTVGSAGSAGTAGSEG